MAIHIKENVPLAPLTTFHIGGNAEFFVEVTTLGELQEAVLWAEEKGVSVTTLGGGSNVLIRDEGVRGLVIHMKLRGFEIKTDTSEYVEVHVGAGEPWDAFVEEMTEKGLWGPENLSGIPGCVGSAPIQNINAYGVSVGDVITSVDVFDVTTKEKKYLMHDDCQFAYRNSFFKTQEGKKCIITHVTFRLSQKKDVHTTYKSSSQSIERLLTEEGIKSPTPSDVRRVVLTIRKNIGMLEGMYQSAGSFFRNTIIDSETFKTVLAKVEEKYPEKSEKLTPWYWVLPDKKVKVSTAFLMECTPYNKTSFAGKLFNETVGISPLHSLSLINVKGGTAADMEAFATHIKETIFTEFGVMIEEEVCMMG